MASYDADDNPPSRNGNGSLTRWTVGAVLGLLLLTPPVLAGLAWRIVDNRLEQQAQHQEVDSTRIRALEVALARNDVQHDAMISLLSRIESDVREHRRESARRNR